MQRKTQGTKIFPLLHNTVLLIASPMYEMEIFLCDGGGNIFLIFYAPVSIQYNNESAIVMILHCFQ